MRFDVDGETDPEESALRGRPRLFGAEGVVPDLGRRLLERLLGGHVLDGHAAGRGVREIGTVEDVAATEVERVEPEPPGLGEFFRPGVGAGQPERQPERGNLIKVVAWYDNEWGYSCRLVDLVNKIAA